ncbi:MAG: ImmA/IrrE family metallo-endopeptidase, partial [Acetobacteraceae bacterium]
AIRRARSVREWAIELSDAATTNAVTLPANTDPEAAAAAIRQRLGITRKAQRAWHDEYEALAGWRAAIESVGVLTMQMRRVDIAEARGFSLPASPLPAVVANSKDWPRGRLFTFLHELAHVSLGQSGVCSLDETAQVEARCNAIAGAVLMPAEELRLEAAPHPGGDWGDAELDALSRRFGASREAVLVRLLTLRLASRTDYQRRQEGFARAYEVARQRRPGGRADPPADAVRSCGTTFARLVLEGLSRGRITGADASEYLGIRFKHLPAVQAELAGAAERQA